MSRNRLLSFIIIIIIFILVICKLNSIRQEEVYKLPYKNSVIALNYHRVREGKISTRLLELFTQSEELTKYNVYEDTFEEQMDTLIAEGAYFATPDEIIEFCEKGEFPEKCVWITFDDVDKSVYENAFPILKERNIPFTLFVISGQVGNENFGNLEMATWDDLREMRDSGLASFGSHTHDMHYLENDRAIFLYESNLDEFEKDIQESKRVIERELDIKIDSIAYPFGDTTDEVTEIVNRNGFSKAYILSPNPIEASTDHLYQNRYLIDKNNFNKILDPWFDLFD